MSAERPLRRPLLIPVAIAAMLLTIAGGSAGFALGSRAARDAAAGTASSGAAPQGRAPVERVATRVACPATTGAPAAKAGAHGALVRVAEFQAELSTVWICADARGRLFMHGDRPPPEDTWIPGETPLVADPSPAGEGYTARYFDDNQLVNTITVDRAEYRSTASLRESPVQVQTMVKVTRWAPG